MKFDPGVMRSQFHKTDQMALEKQHQVQASFKLKEGEGQEKQFAVKLYNFKSVSFYITFFSCNTVQFSL